MSTSMTKFGQKSTSKKPADRAGAAPSGEKFQTRATSHSVEGGVGIFAYTSKPDSSIFGKRSIHLETYVETPCETYEEACRNPDVLQIVYTFNFPEACEQFRKLFATDFNALNAYQFTQSSNQVNVNINGFGQYVLRCPFIPKALCIALDADAYAYTLPVAEVAAGGDSIPPYVAPDGPTNPESITGRLRDNAIFRHGVFTNLMKQFILMSMGIRVEFNCDNIVVDQPMRVVGVQSSNIVCEGTQSIDTPLEDLRNLNCQLQNINSEVRYLPIDNAQGSCDTDVLGAAFSAQVTAVPNNCSAGGDGCVALPCVPLMPGMGIDIILYTQPGQEQSRDDLLRQACTDFINPGCDLPTDILATNLSILWRGVAPLWILHGDSLTEVGTNQPIPLDLLSVEQTVPGVPGTFTVSTKFPSQTAVTFTGPDIAVGTLLTQPAQVTVSHTQYTVGSSQQKVINHGRLQLTFNVHGCYIKRSDLMSYFTKYAVNNHHLRTLMLETREVRDILDLVARDQWEKLGVSKIEAASAGVGALPEIKRLTKKAASDDLDNE
jgi:hypothetical protein